MGWGEGRRRGSPSPGLGPASRGRCACARARAPRPGDSLVFSFTLGCFFLIIFSLGLSVERSWKGWQGIKNPHPQVHGGGRERGWRTASSRVHAWTRRCLLLARSPEADSRAERGSGWLRCQVPGSDRRRCFLTSLWVFLFLFFFLRVISIGGTAKCK